MSNAIRVDVQWEYGRWFGHFRTAMLSVYWVVLLLSAPERRSTFAVACFIALVACSLATSAWSFGRALADGARVLTTLQTPLTMWRAWQRKALTDLAILWCAAVVAGTTALLVSHTGWTWSAAASVFSFVLLVAMTAAFSQFGVWHWAWPWCITLTALVTAVSAGWDGVTRFLQASALWQVPLALVAPLLVAALAWHWRNGPPQGVAARGRVQFNPWRRVAHYAKRYSALYYETQGNGQIRPGSLLQGYFRMWMPFFFLWFTDRPLGAHWGSHAGILYLVRIAFLALIGFRMTMCKDLHWRRVLAPHGYRRGGLGWHIIASTFTVTAAMLAIAAALLGSILSILQWNGIGTSLPLDRLLQMAGQHAVLPLELIFVICAGTVMRALRHPLLAFLTVMFALCAAGLAAVWLTDSKVLFDFFEIGPTYVACLLAAICIMIWIANRLWTTEKLLPFLLTGPTAEDDAPLGGRWFTWPGRRW